MSLGFGVGDIVLLLEAIKEGYDKYKNAPGEVRDAVRDVASLHAGLTYIKKTYLLDEKEFVRLYTEDEYVYPYINISLSTSYFLPFYPFLIFLLSYTVRFVSPPS